MKILLTGSTGMVGMNIVSHSNYRDFEWLLPTHMELDLLDYRSVEAYLVKQKPEFIIHAAGKVGGIQANIREPVSFLVENMEMGKNLLLAASRCGIKKLLNLGSSCMYPKNRDNALKEEDVLSGELEPTNEGYALAKIAIAKLASYINTENEGYFYKTIIPCNLYGLHDKFDPRWSHMIPAVIRKLHIAKKNGSSVVDIWGGGYARREFMYAGDLADAIYHAINNIETMPELLNIGVGHDFSIKEYYNVAAKIIGYDGDFYHDLSKPEGMNRKLTCVDKAHNWGWCAKTSLEDGLAKTYEYFLQHDNEI